MLHASASAPALGGGGRGGGGGKAYAHSQRVERTVPPLALVPLDQLQELRRRKATEGEERSDHPKARVRRRQPDVDDQHRQEEQQRLGERFLGMMAQLARLRRVDLEGSDPSTRSGPRVSPQTGSKSPSALEKLVENKRRGVGPVRSAQISLSPHHKPEPVVNVATAPLREHLTFEISMLLPPPMDTRQSALQSPIHRQKRKRRLKKRRRKKRPTGAVRVDGKRTWQTSHATWVPHASADYAQARAAEGFAATAGSKLVAKFAALRTTPSALSGVKLYAVGAKREERRGREPSEKDPEVEEDECREEEESAEEGDEDQSHRVVENNLLEQVEEDEEDEDEEEAEEEEEGEDDEDNEEDQEDGEAADTLPELLPSSSSTPITKSTHRPPLLRPVQTHQAAWISPDLRMWLIHSGLFRTSHSPQSQ